MGDRVRLCLRRERDAANVLQGGPARETPWGAISEGCVDLRYMRWELAEAKAPRNALGGVAG